MSLSVADQAWLQASLLSVQVVWDTGVQYNWHLLRSGPLLQYPFLCSLLSWLRSNLLQFPFKRLLMITGQLPWLMFLLHLVRLQVSRELGTSPRFLWPSPPCVIMLQIAFLGLAFKLSPPQNLDCSLMPSLSLLWAFAWMMPPFVLLLVFAWDFHCAILTFAVAVVVMFMSLPLIV